MKYLLLLCMLYPLCLLSCHTKKPAASKVLFELPFFSMDSLANINYFDYYGKPVRELIKNDVIRAGGGWGVCSNNVFSHLQFSYSGEESINDMYVELSNHKVSCFPEPNELPIPPELDELLDATIKKIKFTQYFERINSEEEERIFIDKFTSINFEDYYGKPINEFLNLSPIKEWSLIEKIYEPGCEVTFVYILYEKVPSDSPYIKLYLKVEEHEGLNACGMAQGNLNGVRNRNLKEIRISSNNREIEDWLIATDIYLFDHQRPVTKNEAERKEFIAELLKINFEDYYGQPVGKLLSLPVLKKWTGKPYLNLDCSEVLGFLFDNGETMAFALYMEPTEENVDGCFQAKRIEDIKRDRILNKVEIYTFIEGLKSIAEPY